MFIDEKNQTNNDAQDDNGNAIEENDNSDISNVSIELLKQYEEIVALLKVENDVLKKEAKESLENLGKCKNDVDSMKKNLLTTYADMENLRKRLEREKDDAFKYSITKFSRDLLTVVDNFKRAQENLKNDGDSDCENIDSVKHYIDGIALTHKHFLQLLLQYSVRMIEVNIGDKLNPELHQVMCEGENIEGGTIEKGHILQVLQDGFMIENRLLRPTLVSVAR